MKPATERCRICEQPTNPESFPLCSYCGALLVEVEDLDLSPNADLVTIFKKPKLSYLQ